MIRPIQVSDKIFRGPRPETTGDFILLGDYGIKNILDLQGDPWEALTHAANEREVLAWKLDKRTVRIAMNGFFPPNSSDVLDAVGLLQNALSRIYIHCRWGVDRTGYVIAVWRMMYCGWTYNAAVAEMRNNGFHAIYFYWLPSLRKYEQPHR